MAPSRYCRPSVIGIATRTALVGVVDGDLRLADPDLEVAAVLVVADDPLAVLLEHVLLELAGAGEPGEDRPGRGLHLAEQLLLGQGLDAAQRDLDEPVLLALLDHRLEPHLALAGRLDRGAHQRLVVALLAVERAHALDGGGDRDGVVGRRERQRGLLAQVVGA